MQTTREKEESTTLDRSDDTSQKAVGLKTPPPSSTKAEANIAATDADKEKYRRLVSQSDKSDSHKKPSDIIIQDR